MKKIILTLIFVVLSSATAFGQSGKIYLNEELMEYESFIDENGCVYIPLRIYEKLSESVLSWNPENKEILAVTPIYNYYTNGMPRYDSIWFHSELRVFADLPIVYTRDFDFVTGELVGMGWGSYDAPVIIKDDRTMIPLISSEHVSVLFSDGVENIADISFKTGSIPYHKAFIDRECNIYFRSIEPHNTLEVFSYREIDPEQWIWVGDEHYIKQSYTDFEYDLSNAVYQNYLHMTLETDSGNEIDYKFSLPSYSEFAQGDGIANSEGITVQYSGGAYFLDKAQFRDFRDRILMEKNG